MLGLLTEKGSPDTGSCRGMENCLSDGRKVGEVRRVKIQKRSDFRKGMAKFSGDDGGRMKNEEQCLDKCLRQGAA
jgi:hypothetical protein